MAVVIDEGEGELEVKPVGPRAVFVRATSPRARRDAPGTRVPKKRRKKLKSGEGGAFGDPRLFPVRRGSAREAYWSSSNEHAAFWEWDGLDVEDWAARMQVGTPSPELSEPALEADADAVERRHAPELAAEASEAVPFRRAPDPEGEFDAPARARRPLEAD